MSHDDFGNKIGCFFVFVALAQFSLVAFLCYLGYMLVQWIITK